jgi:signal transduction histidine kinase/class 3 adenylate cyclase
MAWALWLRCCALAMLLFAVAGCHHAESLPTGAQATPHPVVIDDAFEEMSLGKRLELAYDPTGELTVDDVLAGKLSFTRSTKDVPSFGFRKGAEWARVMIDDRRAASREPLRLVFEQPEVARLEVYDVDGSKVTRRRIAGQLVPVGEWDVRVSRMPAFTVPPGTATVLIRTSGDSPHQLPIRILTRDQHEDAVRTDVLMQSLFFGSLVSITAYNALLALATRSRTYAYYVGYLLSWCLFSVGFGGLLVFAQVPRWLNVSNVIEWSLLGPYMAIGFFSTRFARSLLGLPSNSIWSRGLAWYSAAGPITVLGASLISFRSAFRAEVALLIPWTVLLLGSGVSAARRADRLSVVARTFLLAWSFFLAGSLVNGLRVSGMVPTNALTINVNQVGSAVEFLLLSLALATRIKALQTEAIANAERAAAHALAAEKATAMALAEQRRANDEQARTNAELARMDKLKDTFLANTSHELRTPLHGILGLTESVLAANSGLDPTARERLGMVLASGRRLSSLVNDILDFSKLRHQSIALREKHLDLREAANLALSVVTSSADVKGLALRSKVVAETFVRADENRLQQILVNLLGNAVKFTAQGEVVVRAEPRDGRVFVSVQDTGIGIPKESRERIFESFEQADGSTSREYGGTGLGLAVTKQLVELHGGQVVVDSEPGVGSTFTFDVPLGDRSGASAPSNEATRDRGSMLLRSAAALPGTELTAAVALAEAAPLSTPIDAGTRGHVLVADDDPVNVEVLRAQLEPAGYTVSTARDGAEAVAALERLGQVDSVLLDVMMPKMTGVEAAARIREANPHGTLPILMLTAKSRPEDVIVGMRAGASDYIGKPFHREELLQRVDAHVQALKTSRAFRRFVPENFLGLLGVERFDALTAGIGQRHEVTVLFADVRGFTTRSEQLGPEGIFRFINACLERFEPIVRRHGGFVDKFIGDAIMAIFPGDPREAAHAAADLHRAVADFNAAGPHGQMPLAIGVGVHCGPVILGTIGGADRMEVTAIGDAVNVAARLESLTRPLGVGALVSESVVADAKASARRVGAVRVKGRTEPVELFELVACAASEAEREQKIGTAEPFQRGLRAFAQEDIARAGEHFAACVASAPLDRVAALYLERCAQYQVSGVPERFDGCLENV